MKLLRKTYLSRLIDFDCEAYNLPLDAIYYVESPWNYRLNNYVYSHQQLITDLLKSRLGGVFPYRLEIISANQFRDSVIQQQLQHLHPETPNIDFSTLPTLNAQQKYEDYI